MRSSKVSRRSAYVRALQRTDSHGHTASQSFLLIKCEPLAFFFKNLGKILGFQSCSKHQFLMKLLLQSPLKTFLEVVWSYPRYLEGRPRSELYNGNKIMAIRRTNHFLLFKTFIPPLNAGFGNRFFIVWKQFATLTFTLFLNFFYGYIL